MKLRAAVCVAVAVLAFRSNLADGREEDTRMVLAPPAAGQDPLAAPSDAVLRGGKAEQQLRRYLRGSREPVLDPVPWPIEPTSVARFVMSTLRAGPISALHAHKLALLVRTYLLSDASRDLAVALDQPGPSSAADAWLATALAWVAAEADVANAVASYRRIAATAESEDEIDLDALVAMRDAFGPRLTADPLSTALRARAARLRARGARGDEVDAELIEDELAGTFQEIEWADAARHEVATKLVADDQIVLLLDFYLERTEHGGERFLGPWSVLQIRRSAQRGDRPKIVAGARRKLDEIEGDGDSFERVRLLKLLEYFGAPLAAAERAVLAEHGRNQRDPLSRDALAGGGEDAEKPAARPRPGR